MKTTSSTYRRSYGITLIELLVVISILAVITAYLVPKVRVFSAERDIRESARKVGSFFNSAAQRALVEGGCGVVIVSNPNIVDTSMGGNVYYAGTTLYHMRATPPYTGDSPGAVWAPTINPYEITIPLPFEHDAIENRYLIQIDDYVRLNHSALRYRIADVVQSGTILTLTLDDDNGTKPELPVVPISFLIERQPRVLRSSRVDLPEGYMIDMRYSGPTWAEDSFSGDIVPCHVDTGAYTQGTSEEVGTVFNQEISNAVVVLFNGDGGIDRVRITPQDSPSLPNATPLVNGYHPPANNGRITGPLYLLIAENDPNPTNLTIQRNESLWVSVGNNTGSVNIGVNNATDGGDPTIIDGLLTPIYPQTNLNRASILHARTDAGLNGTDAVQ